MNLAMYCYSNSLENGSAAILWCQMWQFTADQYSKSRQKAAKGVICG